MSVRVIRYEEASGAEEARLAMEFVDLDSTNKETLEILISRVMEGQQSSQLDQLKPGASPPEIRKALESVPLAHRISLAARAAIREREWIRHDPHPAVLESLVRNPNITLQEIRAIAAFSHLQPSTLDVLAQDSRWLKDEELRLTVASHPRVSLTLAERLMGEMPHPVLQKLLKRPGVNQILKEKIVRRLNR